MKNDLRKPPDHAKDTKLPGVKEKKAVAEYKNYQREEQVLHRFGNMDTSIRVATVTMSKSIYTDLSKYLNLLTT